jgi:hypothetical protein
LSGAAEAQPHLLQRFLLLVHGDLKHFVFSYWWVPAQYSAVQCSLVRIV